VLLWVRMASSAHKLALQSGTQFLHWRVFARQWQLFPSLCPTAGRAAASAHLRMLPLRILLRVAGTDSPSAHMGTQAGGSAGGRAAAQPARAARAPPERGEAGDGAIRLALLHTIAGRVWHISSLIAAPCPLL
jgi:hypothetical protein